MEDEVIEEGVVEGVDASSGDEGTLGDDGALGDDGTLGDDGAGSDEGTSPDDIIFWTMDGGDAPTEEGISTDEPTDGGVESGVIVDLDGDGVDDNTGEVIFQTMDGGDDGSIIVDDPRSPWGEHIEPNWRTQDIPTATLAEAFDEAMVRMDTWDSNQPWACLV